MTDSEPASDASPHLVIAGGGTGGHLFPGVAVAEQFVAQRPNAKVTFVGTASGIEARAIPRTPFDLEIVDVRPLKGGSILGRLGSLARLPASAITARRLLKRLAPDVVVSVGGFAAGPITMVASFMGIATALMEQNSYPGLTNRMLSRVVDQAFLTFADSGEYLHDVPCEVTGNPVRQELLTLARDFQYEPPTGEGPFRILIIGGSGGAGSFNTHLPKLFGAMEELAPRLHIRHQVGRDRRGEVGDAYDDFAGQAEVVEFIDDMAQAYRWCDLLICRAGATTIAEVLNLGIPAVYIPFPHAADDHQTANARTVVEAGAGVMIGDDEINSRRARNLLTGFINNPVALANLARQARQLGRPQAAEAIATALLKLARRR